VNRTLLEWARFANNHFASDEPIAVSQAEWDLICEQAGFEPDSQCPGNVLVAGFSSPPRLMGRRVVVVETWDLR
jgi:hypothetical protein